MPEIVAPTGLDPSILAGSQLPSAEAFDGVAQDVIGLFDLEKEQFEEAVHGFVLKRSEELSAGAETNRVGSGYGGTTDFISSNSEMFTSALMSRPYYMDDPEAYQAAFPHLQRYYEQFIEKGHTPDRAYVNAALNAATYGQAEYFQSVYGDNDANADLTSDIVSDDEPKDKMSIADFKGIAVCQERAAVVHNTLHILGVQSEFVAGQLLAENNGKTETEDHAFLLVKNHSEQKFIVDPSNPVLFFDEHDELITIQPGIYKYDPNEQHEQKVRLRKMSVIDGEANEIGSQSLVYRADFI